MAVLLGMAKQSPCAAGIIAVLMPMTSPRVDTSGPPEFPGFNAASVWITSSISRPPTERNERPSALTTPAVTAVDDLQRVLTDEQVGKPAPVTVLRDWQRREIMVTPVDSGA